MPKLIQPSDPSEDCPDLDSIDGLCCGECSRTDCSAHPDYEEEREPWTYTFDCFGLIQYKGTNYGMSLHLTWLGMISLFCFAGGILTWLYLS